MNRRLFIHYSSSTLLATLSSLGNSVPLTKWKGKVAIIGAGASGLYAADLLTKRGVDVVVLEASGRAGGRIRALHGFANFPIELGAESIHGGEKTDLYRLAIATKIDLYKEHEITKPLYYVEGNLMEEQELAKDKDFQTLDALFDTIFKYKGPDMSLTEFIKRSNIPIRLAAFYRLIGSEIGSSNDKVTIKSLRSFQNLLDVETKEKIRMAVPYENLFQSIIQHLQTENRIHFNTPVSAINYTSNQVTLTTENNEQLIVDKVLITVPLPVLKKNTIHFSPVLPVVKRKAIDALPFGNAVKVILKFRQRVWRTDMASLLGGKYAVYWPPLGSILGNDSVLTAFASGENADRISTQSHESTIQLLVNELSTLLNQPGLRNHFTDAYVQDWSQDPYIGGYVTYPATELFMKYKQNLAQPIDQKLFFAGEATNIDVASLGYVHGALKTSVRAVKELINSP